MGAGHTYIAIDLKSFYASAECRRLKLDPLNTNLVVADSSRTEKTICLAVSPSLKAHGISGRPRLFEVVQAVKEINARRKLNAPGRRFRDKSYYASELSADPSLELDYVVAPPHMAHYMNVSAQIYDIYLNYVAPEDIHVVGHVRRGNDEIQFQRRILLQLGCIAGFVPEPVPRRIEFSSGIDGLDSLDNFEKSRSPRNSERFKRGRDRKAYCLLRPGRIRYDQVCIQRIQLQTPALG